MTKSHHYFIPSNFN